jgi:2-hydroxymuconate-semialdehyde hydrolase
VAAESWNLIPQLGRLGMPTLVIHGARDVVPLEVATEIAHAMPAAQLVVLSDCGHFSYLEHPELLDATITEFLTTHSPSPA